MIRYFQIFSFTGWLLVNTATLWAQDYKDPQNMPVEPQNTDCQKLPETFEDPRQALAQITSSRFNLEQHIKTTRVRGLMAASYHSCDFEQGYLVVKYDGKHYIYPQVPVELWKEFRQTADIDGYYLKKIQVLNEIKNE